jgi:hypothetical protein
MAAAAAFALAFWIAATVKVADAQDSQAQGKGLTPVQATAPAGGSANPDTIKAKAKGRGRGRGRFQGPIGPTPRLPDGHPDFTGVWQGGGPIGDITQGLPKGETLPIKPEALALQKSRNAKNDPEANCLPTGVPRIAPYPWRILRDPDHFYFIFEGNIHSWRQIFMNAKHPADPDPTWYGHSIGSWDKDTLVVDTVGFNDKFWFDFAGHPHTEQLHTIERYTRTDLGTLDVKTTIIDPGDYTRPFTIDFKARLRPHEELMEYICQENNQDPHHIDGHAGLF